MQYENRSEPELYAEPVKRIVNGREAELEFMHIPKTGGTFVEQYKGHYPPWHDGHPELLLPEFNCAISDHHGLCRCAGWHVAPRFYVPSVFEGKSTFCFVRDPLDRMVSEWKMNAHKRIRWNIDHMGELYEFI